MRGFDGRLAIFGAAAIAAGSFAGCSLFVSTSDLAGSAAGPDSADASSFEATSGDGAPDAPLDAPDDVVGADADGAPPLPTDVGLVARFRFDENTATTAGDTSPINAGGGLFDGASWTPGKFGSALSFLQTASRVEAPHHAARELMEAFTVSLWLNINASTAAAYAFSNGYSFFVSITGGRPQLSFSGKSATAEYAMPLGQWHQIAVTFDRGTVAWYVDGGPVALHDNTVAATDRPVVDGLSIKIGNKVTEMSPINGAVDEVRFYNRALSAAEIAPLATNP